MARRETVPAVSARSGPPRVAGWLAERGEWIAQAIPPIVAGAIAFVLIFPTVLPNVSNWDTAEFQTVLPVLGTAHPTGFPSYVILGWLASLILTPVGQPAYRVDLLQAMLAGVAVAATVGVARQLGVPRLLALATGLVMTSTFLFWRLSTHADPHMFHVALLALLLVLLVGWEKRRRSEDEAEQSRADRWLVATTVVYGVAVANHSLALLLAPGIALFVLLVEPGILFRWHRSRLGIPWGIVGTCAAVLVATIVLLFLELPVRAMMHAPLVYGQPDTWSGFWYVVLAEQFTSSLVQPFTNVGTKAFDALGILQAQLGWALYVLPLGFIAAIVRRPRTASVAGLSIVAVCLLLAPDQFSGALQDNDVAPYCLPLGLAALIALRPRYGALTGAWLVVTVWFAMSYTNADIQRYYLGPLLIAFTWVAVSAWEALSVAAAILSLPDWPRIGAALPKRIAEFGATLTAPGGLRSSLTEDVVRNVPAPRDDRPVAVDRRATGSGSDRRAQALIATLVPVIAIAFVAPQISPIADRYHVSAQPGGANESQWTKDQAWLDEVMAGLPRDAAVISWWSTSTTLWYGQRAEGMRPDVVIADDRTLLDMGLHDDIPLSIDYFRAQGRPVFVIRLPRDLPPLQRRYELKPWFDGTMYQVIGPTEQQP